MKHLLSAAALAALAGFALPGGVTKAEAAECIAPADPGGGWDFTCRTVGRLLTEEGILDAPVQVVNMPGGVGAVAYARVMNSESDNPDLVVATSTVGITQIAQGKYPAGTDAMRWLAMLGADVGVVLVAADSPYNTLDDLFAAMKENVGSVVTSGSTAAGGWDHIRLLMLAQAAGMGPEEFTKIRWVQFDGGTPAVTQMMGGQTQVVVTDLGEIAGFVESGDVKVLAAMSDEPIPAFPDLPTAKSQGYDVTGYNWRGFYTGGKVSDEAYDKWVSNLETLFNSEAWKEAAEANGLIPIWRGGKEFNDYVVEQASQMEAISREIGVIK
ncbi:tripartite tricarboxylate transporter substrate binding protein [Acuticoccus sp. M5D2P5]|uniref:Bug family tripartite tricarboxylate transporter substrate binding protein n=1 Tax=Acuticoccus kalidii TaxID=2910977 RepID=UPI001F3D1236|nr:tripartite tricarboxylate transporter substrate-binding protein [Acuticoccus kalidii]MCF3933095.1 tripartite tricarboxylate transporter substrate binding protein [Acuticoccus kalidii]